MFKLQGKVLPVVGMILFNHALHAQLTITSGTNLVANNGLHIVLNNTGLSNSGTITAAGSTFEFTGTASASNTPLSSAGAISNITINKSAGSVQLGGNVSVTNTVQLISGVLNLNGYDLNLGTTGSLSGESASSYITGATGGAVVSTATLNNPVAATPGNMGITISSSNLGTTTIRRGHQVQTITSTANSINRYFDISPTNTSGLGANIRISYLDNELNGLSESGLGFYSSLNSGTTWVGEGADSRDIIANYVEEAVSLSNTRLTLADNSITLPIRLLSFTGKLGLGGTELQWVTASEQNNSVFEVTHSEDGISFSRFASVSSHGNSNSPHTYTVTDSKPFSAMQFYRLKQIDKDGSYTYSKVVALSKTGYENKIIHVFPSPARSVLYINFTSSSPSKVNLQVVNSVGRPVMSRDVQAASGLNTLTLAVGSLPAGVYYIHCTGLHAQPMRFTKVN